MILDTECTGLRWWGGDLPVGLAVATLDGRAWYLPWAHAGGNLPEERVKEWCLRELRGRNLIFFNAPFDINMLHAWGVDLESMGCTVSDVGTYAALLDDTRRRSNLDAISKEYLGVGKLEAPSYRMQDLHASQVEEYAERDVLLCQGLREKLWPMLQEQDLMAVLALEDELLYVTAYMMRQGSPVDEEKLAAWSARAARDEITTAWELHKLTGLRINMTGRKDPFRLFHHLGIEPPINDDPKDSSYGKPTLKREYLAKYDHPAIQLLMRGRQIASLRAKFLNRYSNEVARNGRLMYSLHQLRVDDEGGTVSGRYSSSGFGTDPEEGINIQQVGGKKQQNAFKGDEVLEGYAIRELFVPESGLWLSADADQIEYRLFAHYGKPPRVLEAYARDPNTDFHNIVMEMVREVYPKITRERTKDVNFAKLYGAQLAKIARMIGIPEEMARPLVRAYDRQFPQAERLLRDAARLAEDRGWVRTMLGRRARFEPGQPTYSALNRVIQGTAADVMKLKLVELHKARRDTGFILRFTVHDEVDGDVPDLEAAAKVRHILNRQSLETRVPLLWGVGTGPNWKEAKAA